MEGEAGAAPRMPLDPARRRAGGRGRGEHALQFRASAFVPPPGKGEGDAAECRICLQTDLCTALIKPCGCEHKPSRSAYVHQGCILKWIERDKRSREGGCKICKQDWKFQEKGKKRGIFCLGTIMLMIVRRKRQFLRTSITSTQSQVSDLH